MNYSLFVLLNSDIEPCDIRRMHFGGYEDVNTAFAKLFTVCKETVKFSDENFDLIRNSCVTRSSEPLRKVLKQTTNTDDLFEVLSENNKYCNWMDVTYLKAIATVSDNYQLLSLIKNYTDVIYSKTLGEIWNYMPYISVRNKYYDEVKSKFSVKDSDIVILKELIKSEPKLAKSIAMLIAVGDYDGYPIKGMYVCTICKHVQTFA